MNTKQNITKKQNKKKIVCANLITIRTSWKKNRIQGE